MYSLERVAYLTEIINLSIASFLIYSSNKSDCDYFLLGMLKEIFSLQELKDNTIIMTGLADVTLQQRSMVMASLKVERMEYGWKR